MRLPWVLAASLALLAPPVHGAPANKVGSVTYRPAVVAAPAPSPMHPEGVMVSRRVELARPSAAERAAKVAAFDRSAGPASGTSGKRQAIGFGREVAADARRVDLASLAWTTLADGARVARIEVSSSGARGVRVALRLRSGLDGVSVRFAAFGAREAMASISAVAIAQATAQFGDYWTPPVDGERVAIELEAQAHAVLGDAALEIMRVSHLLVAPTSGREEEAKLLSDVGDAGSCNFNVKCVTPQDAVTLGQAAGTAKLVFTNPSGDTLRCTGTLLNDIGTTHTPYVFASAVCFPSAYEASTLSVWWFFDAAACNSNMLGEFVVQTGGAVLLARSQDGDWALLRLNTAPPTGVSFRGWDAATVAPGSEVETYHHPGGDLKKWSLGTSFAQETVDFGPPAGTGALFTRVVWSTGTTEFGSSGGALTVYDVPFGDLLVRGALLGGDALCSNPGGSDFFSQIGAMLPLVRQHLTPANQVAGLVVSVEYYNANLNHFFMTINPAEIAGLDSGVIVGWKRTGFRFLAYDSPGPGRNPVCRFYRKPEFGDSHFFTADPAECATVAQSFATDWVFESPAIYYVQLPNTATGVCPVGTKPVYRYLNTAEINHRFTTEKSVALALKNTPGWTPEGYGLGPLFPVMCSPVGS